MWYHVLRFLLPLAFLLRAAEVAAAREWQRDVRRALARIPRDRFRGENAPAASAKLNGHLRRIPSLSLQECDSLGLEGVRGAVERMHVLAEPEFLRLYDVVGDPRRRSAESVASLRAQWAEIDSMVLQSGDAALANVVRDGLCHEAVMAFVHHLSADTRRELATSPDFVLPLLPHDVHHAATDRGAPHRVVYDDYLSKVSCQQCHTGPMQPGPWVNASLPLPLPKDKTQPGLERLRSCDYQNKPGCGPCEGLGGRRWGDGVHEFKPVPCEVVATPEHIPPAERVKPAYPSLGTAHITGDTRSPLAVRPAGPGKYSAMDIQISLGWDSAAARQRYDFRQEAGGTASQIYLQTRGELRSRNATGITVTIVPNGTTSTCVCEPSLAGNMHIDAFVAHERFDPLDLPASEGGVAYLGRVKLSPIDDANGTNRTVIADHYMKWAFHFLVDASATSTRGKPLRLYGPYGVRQVFSDWNTTDPAIARPDVWDIPSDCELRSDECRDFAAETDDTSVVV
eukprot:gnl/TRDRNA2_/TRDRNA2_80178_c0_seq1.p1 gnl/TRDRNA2_/TRDRNA2_80178_c0~~gnl/TRDRNA2_/TRDRNA2_80178_c0_seq1.p1  ORF type:complete len:511 (+),score=82.36 gnl/TRDRNA2_/TRDRNA2_80178_c0_seq1:40-1572(+)